MCLENKKEKLYLANSKDLVSLIIELQLTEFWPNLRFDRQVLQSVHGGGASSSNGRVLVRNAALQQKMLLQDDIEKKQQIDKMV